MAFDCVDQEFANGLETTLLHCLERGALFAAISPIERRSVLTLAALVFAARIRFVALGEVREVPGRSGGIR